MTDPAIMTVDHAALNGIIQRGKPQGLYMAMSGAFPGAAVSAHWTGVDSRPGHLCLMKRGSFPEVLDWLMFRGGIMKRGEPVRNRNPSREREWSETRPSALPVRIEGAEVKDWKEPPGQVMGFEGTPVAGIDAERLKRSRKRSGAAAVAKATEQEEQIIKLYEAGATYNEIAEELGVVPSTVYERIRAMKARGEKLTARRDQQAIEARDAEILKLALSGMMWTRIAETLGVTVKVVSHRIKVMRMKGFYIPNKAKLEAEAKNRERDERVIQLVKEGLALSAIARETGEQKRAVSRRLQRLREEGRI